ncbi:MAG: RHS repeat protein [Alteromonadaceae bacterium]|nr:RHS repeat protein [Alteromonadaceae bacterium]
MMNKQIIILFKLLILLSAVALANPSNAGCYYTSFSKDGGDNNASGKWGVECTPMVRLKGGTFTIDGERMGIMYSNFYHNPHPYPNFSPETSTSAVDAKGNPTSQGIQGNCAGNPILIGSGNKVQIEQDYKGQGEFPLEIKRIYNNFSGKSGVFGYDWFSSFDYKFEFQGEPGQHLQIITMTRPDGMKLDFQNFDYADSLHTENTYYLKLGKYDASKSIKVIYDPALKSLTYIDPKGFKEIYKKIDYKTWKISSRTNLRGIKHTYAYQSGKITSITHSSGRSLTFTYTGYRPTTISDPAGNKYRYKYTNNSLIKVTFPDNNYREYFYKDLKYVGTNLERIDWNGKKYATFKYDSNNKGKSTAHGGRGNVDKYEFKYTSQTSNGKQTYTTRLTNPLGHITNYIYQDTGNGKQLVSVDRQSSDYCSSAKHRYTYTKEGYKDVVTDWDGNKTDHDYFDNGKLKRITSAKGTSVERTVSFEWDDVFPTFYKTITQEESIQSFEYYPTGHVKNITVTNTSIHGVANQKRKFSFRYVIQPSGIVTKTTIDGPRTDVSDITVLNYDKKGNLTKVTDAVGHKTYYRDYNKLGQVGEIESANGLKTFFSYNVRGWLLSKTVGGKKVRNVISGGRKTSFTYWPHGAIKRITSPRGGYIESELDDALRVNAWFDHNNERQEFGRDAMGNVTWTTYENSDHVQQFKQRLQYDKLGRFRTTLGENGQYSTITYTNNSNIDLITNGYSNITSHDYNEQNELTRVTDADNKITTRSYNKQGIVNKVNDARLHATLYMLDGFGQIVKIVSPESGTSTFVYDEAGNVIKKTDANATVSRYKYDAFNRNISVVAGNEKRSFQYDKGTNSKGLLTKVENSHGYNRYSYNDYGEKTSQQTKIKDKNYRIDYTYHSFGGVKDITYPSGNKVTYQYLKSGKVAGITAKINNQRTKNVITDLSYKPFGPVTSMTYGNSLKRAFTYDQDYRLTSIATPGIHKLNFTYYGHNNNMLNLENVYNQRLSQYFIFDDLHRLTTVYSKSGEQHFSYDSAGNRTKHNGLYYTIDIRNNRLKKVGSLKYNYDRNGNLTSTSGGSSYTYNNFNRLVSYTDGASANFYGYNSLGQRIFKSNGNTKSAETKRFMFDTQGNLLAETNNGSSMDKEYIYLYGQPIALINDNTLYYIYNDQLGRPEVVTNSNANIVWKASNFAFDRTVTKNKIGDLNIGFPGQYWDEEKGSYYNMFRDYDPETGRYLQSDPIGLAGGLNTYAYVGGNPVSFYDSLGLSARDVVADQFPVVLFTKLSIIQFGNI